MKAGDSAYFVLRLTRKGPLLPAKIWLCDHDPADKDNKLDRGNLSVFPRAEIGGKEVDPDILQRDRLMSPTDWRPAYAPTHWKFAQIISRGEYRYRVARHAWEARQQPQGLPMYEAVEPRQMPMPVFETELADE